MPKIMTLPKIGVNMTEATIVEWVAKEGDTIKVGDHILDAETDKAVQEIEATEAGVLAKILAQPGQVVECQKPIAILTEPGEKLPDDFDISVLAGEEKTEPAQSPAATQAVAAPQQSAAAQSGGRVKISPSAKKLAKESGLDYTQIRPSKAGARITEADVKAFAEGKSVGSGGQAVMGYENTVAEVIALSGARKTIAERMSKSCRENARTILSLHADAGKLIEWRQSLNKEGPKVSYNDLLVAVASRALSEFPIMNSRIAGDRIELLADINVGVAVDTERGLLVPVIRNADKKDAGAISKDFKEKLERIQAGKNTLEDITGGTFTISNLGMLEIEVFTPVINPPECAILGIGAIVREPVVSPDSDKIEVRPRLQFTLAFDHRIVDGAPAARFLQRIKHLVEEPSPLKKQGG